MNRLLARTSSECATARQLHRITPIRSRSHIPRSKCASPATSRRQLSTSTPETPPTAPAAAPEDPEKATASAKRASGRGRTSKGLDGSGNTQISFGPEVSDTLIWLPEQHPPASDESALPPEDMILEALSNLHVSFHPKTQHRATYPSSAGQPQESPITLYCPIEGGTYIIDAAVQELARRSNSELLVVDALDILAGEWGIFASGPYDWKRHLDALLTWSSSRAGSPASSQPSPIE